MKWSPGFSCCPMFMSLKSDLRSLFVWTIAARPFIRVPYTLHMLAEVRGGLYVTLYNSATANDDGIWQVLRKATIVFYILFPTKSCCGLRFVKYWPRTLSPEQWTWCSLILHTKVKELILCSYVRISEPCLLQYFLFGISEWGIWISKNSCHSRRMMMAVYRA